MQTVYDCFPNIDEQRTAAKFPDIKDEFFWRIFKKCEPYTMIGVDALYNVYRSVEYIVRNKIEGDFVECGVFLGGTVMAAAEFLNHFEGQRRKIYLFDTFEGFPENTEDLDIFGNSVKFHSHRNFKDVVMSNLASCDYDTSQFEFAVGPVEKTLRDPAMIPSKVAYLRLDTDYYESTRIEFEVLYPKLVSRGICTIDDYGTFQGSKRATDEYLSNLNEFPFVNRINQGVRVFVKP